MKTRTKTIDTLLNQSNPVISIESNKTLGLVKLKRDDDTHIKYMLDILYKVGNAFEFGTIKELSSNNEYLVTVESIRKLGSYGYIENIIIRDNGQICDASNHRKSHSNIKKYDIKQINTNTTALIEKLKELEIKFTYILDVDDELENAGWSRLEPYALIYSLGKKLCALCVKDEFGSNNQILEINKFIQMASYNSNLGKHSSRSNEKNFSRVLNYFEISCEDYNNIEKLLGVQALRGFTKHTNGPYYRCNFEDLSMQVAELYFCDNIYLAIPKPERFSSKQWFESAIWDPKNCDITRYSNYSYENLLWNKVNVNWAKNRLLQDYDKLHTQAYLQSFNDIAEYLLEADNYLNNTSMTDRMREVYDAYLKGNFDDTIVKKAGIMVADDDLDDLHKDYINWKIVNSSLDIECIKRFMRPATIEEIAEFLGETLPVVDEYSNAVMNMEIVVNEDNVPTEYLDTHDMQSIETEKEVEITNMKQTRKVLNKIYLSTDKSNRLEVRTNELKEISFYIILNDEEIPVNAYKQSLLDYINNGVNIEAIRQPLKRALLVCDNTYDVQDIISKLD